MVERCVCCGEIIPEGRMVCPRCERLEQAQTQSNLSIGSLRRNSTTSPQRNKSFVLPGWKYILHRMIHFLS